jgi:hypothetical protein
MPEAKKCDACGIMGPGWARVSLTRDGRIVVSFTLCLACASDAEDAVRAARKVSA